MLEMTYQDLSTGGRAQPSTYALNDARFVAPTNEDIGTQYLRYKLYIWTCFIFHRTWIE